MKELIRKILNEETKPGKYISVLEDLTEYFKNEDCVCDIKISYKPEEFRDLYLINVVLGVNEINSKFNGINYQIRDYLQKLRRKITDGVLDFLPVPFLVNFSETPKCKDYKNLQESEDKKSRLLSTIEQDGLYQVMQDTGLTLKQIKSKIGEIPREVFERYIKDIVSEKGFQMYEGFILLYDVEISHNKYTEHFYLKGDKVMVGIKEYGKHNEQISGGVEDLENLTDDEIYTIVDDMKDYME